MPIRCEIVSQDRIVFQGDVDIVILPGADGEMGILPNHSPVLTVLQFGIITLRIKAGGTAFYGSRRCGGSSARSDDDPGGCSRKC